MMKFGIGQPVPRTEDARLLRGQGRYTGDLTLPGMLHMVLVRSPHAHARITGIETDQAQAVPGVVAVLTGADLDAAGIGPIPCQVPLKVREGTVMAMKHRPVLAGSIVRHGGEPVACIIAETLDAARDAAEQVLVAYDPLPAVVDLAAAAGSPALVHGDAAGNLCFDWEKGDGAAVEAAFARASRVVGLDLVNNRVVANALETRACLAAPGEEPGRLRLWVTSQGVHLLRRLVAEPLGLDQRDLQVLTTDVGGGFGMKIFCYPEYVLATHAARTLGRPVRWVGERGESFLSDDHGRDTLSRAELALDPQGRFLALRVLIQANMGAYLSNFAPFIQTDGQCRMLSGVYRIPAIQARVQGRFTHTQPVDAYRGAGRPEAAYLLERLVDHAGRETGLGPVEIRRRNMIPRDAMPYATPLGHVYDSGDFPANLEDALIRADVAGFAERRRAAAAGGELLGLGIATYIEACAGGGGEAATVKIRPDGTALLLIGTQTNGQGHQTAYQQILADRLGLPLEAIEVVQGDSDRIATGGGTGGSRSIPVGGAAVAAVAGRVIETARARAADLLETAVVDVDFSVEADGGWFTVVGTDRRVAFSRVAASLPADADGFALGATDQWKPPTPTFPNGCHIVEVGVERETGRVRLHRYTVVDDFGTVLNPLLLAGQVHGGIAQGIGQALMEQAVFDPDSGQLLTGSFMDYAMPRADHVPFIDLALNRVPSPNNALGLKGAGEAGSIGAPPAIINALVDALAPFGVVHVDMPATPEVLWRLMQRGAQARAAD